MPRQQTGHGATSQGSKDMMLNPYQTEAGCLRGSLGLSYSWIDGPNDWAYHQAEI